MYIKCIEIVSFSFPENVRKNHYKDERTPTVHANYERFCEETVFYDE